MVKPIGCSSKQLMPPCVHHMKQNVLCVRTFVCANFCTICRRHTFIRFAHKQALLIEILGINLKICLEKVNKYELVKTLYVFNCVLLLPKSKNMNISYFTITCFSSVIMVMLGRMKPS